MYKEKELEENLAEERRDNNKNIRELRKSQSWNRAKNMVMAILFATTLFGAFQYNRAVTLRRQLDNSYNRAFYELVGYVQNMEIMLMKARMTSSPELTAATLNDVWREATAATSSLNQLPISMGILSNTEKFFAQVADLSKSIAKQNTYGKSIDNEQIKTLANLHTFSVSLEEGLTEMHRDLNNGNLKWENVTKEEYEEAREASTNMQEATEGMPKTFTSVNSNFEEMPTLIYDGPYSEHLQNRKALGLTGEKVTEDQAIAKLKEFMKNDKITNISKTADNNNGIINTYNFKMQLGEDKNVLEADVSVIGGHVVWFLYNRETKDPTIKIEEAIEVGRKFLTERGYSNIKDSYYLRNDGVATINFSHFEDGITYYPDLIKVKVALDNGEVVGFEANGYLMNNHARDFGTPQLTQAQAREKINKGDSIEESGLVVIPTNYGTEILCYEFTGKVGDKDFLVYINANTGVEEQVLVIINSEEGILTM